MTEPTHEALADKFLGKPNPLLREFVINVLLDIQEAANAASPEIGNAL